MEQPTRSTAADIRVSILVKTSYQGLTNYVKPTHLVCVLLVTSFSISDTLDATRAHANLFGPMGASACTSFFMLYVWALVLMLGASFPFFPNFIQASKALH